MPIMTYPFTTESNYVKTSMIEFSGGKCQGALQNLPNQDFVENFDNDTGFVYDSSKAEFVAGQVQGKDQRQTDATFAANFNLSKNGNWGDGVLTTTLLSGAVISGNKLDCTSSNLDGMTFDCAGNADFTTVGCIRFKIAPNYSGSPASNSILFSMSPLNNEIYLRHNSSGGNIVLLVRDIGGSFLINNTLGAWSPTSGVEYEFELNIDLVSGATRLFIDGVQSGSTVATTGSRAASTTFYLGRLSSGQGIDATFDDLIIFDTVQHTANYTPGYPISDYIYSETNVTLPEMEWTGVGTLISFDALTYTIGDVPRLSLQIGRSGDYLYWNGSAWVVSNGDYTQASDFATFAANVGSLAILGEIYGQFKIHFNNSNTQSSVSMLTASLTAQKYPEETDAQNVYPTSDFRTDGLENFVATSSTNVKFIMVKNGVDYWYDSANWVTSDGTYSESNTEAELTPTILALFTTTGVQCYPKIVFGGDGTTQEYIDEITITYNFSGDQPVLDISTIWGYLYDSGGNILSNRPITGVVIEQSGFSSGAILDKIETETLTNSDGYWELEIPYDASVIEPPVIEFNINGTKNKKRMSYQETIKYTDLQDL